MSMSRNRFGQQIQQLADLGDAVVGQILDDAAGPDIGVIIRRPVIVSKTSRISSPLPETEQHRGQCAELHATGSQRTRCEEMRLSSMSMTRMMVAPRDIVGDVEQFLDAEAVRRLVERTATDSPSGHER